jgi:hypothetical protein
MTNLTTGPRAGKRSVLRLAAAGLVTLFLGLVAAAFWVVAQDRYLEDYCAWRAPQPEAPTPEALDHRPAYLDGPFTVVCDYHDGLPTVRVFEPFPSLLALVLVVVVVGIGVGLFWWAWRPKPPNRPDSPAVETTAEPR